MDRYGEERMSYIQYRWGGKGSKEIGEPVGNEYESITASKNDIRTMRTVELSKPTERRRRRRSHIWRMKAG